MVCAVLFFFLTAAFGFGQEAGPLIQRLSWQPVDYASRYEVIVEVQAGTETWVEVTRKTSESETFIDCPLFRGSYRFMVEAYDLLGKPGSASGWTYFEVRASREETRAEPYSADTRPIPEESEKTIARLEVLYQPLIILPFSEFNEIYATSPLQPLGFALRFSLMPLVTTIGVFGVELSPSWNYLANDILVTSRYTHILNGHLSLVWQIRPFSRHNGLNFRLGGGMSYVKSRFDFNEGRQVENVKTWNPSVALGISFISFLNKQVFINAGIDYLHIFTSDNIMLNYLRPSVSVGWWF
jgi:hypothetical protein